LALKAGCDIVPVTINGSHRIVSKGKLNINKGQFSMHIGKPISVKEYSKSNVSQLMDRVREKMLNQLNQGRDASQRIW
jgi:1-acyl-sn-glycerol-3-phosphate acyltransferase